MRIAVFFVIDKPKLQRIIALIRDDPASPSATPWQASFCIPGAGRALLAFLGTPISRLAR